MALRIGVEMKDYGARQSEKSEINGGFYLGALR